MMHDSTPPQATGPNTAPILETDRLRLRPHTLSDFDACCMLWADPEVTRFCGGRPNTPEEVWSRLLRYAGHWSLLGFGYWVVEERATGRFVGETGLIDLHRGIDSPLAKLPEAGWVLLPEFHGRGYASEALGAIFTWAAAHLEAPEISCIINPLNVASMGLAAKLGFTERGAAKYRGQATLLLTRSLQT